MALKSFLQKHYKKVIFSVIISLAVLGVNFLAINHYVERIGAQYIFSAQDVPKADTVLILGAYVFPDGTLSPMLYDRVTVFVKTVVVNY